MSLIGSMPESLRPRRRMLHAARIAAAVAFAACTLFYSATRDSKAGAIYLKVVNRAGAPRKSLQSC